MYLTITCICVLLSLCHLISLNTVIMQTIYMQILYPVVIIHISLVVALYIFQLKILAMAVKRHNNYHKKQ